MQHPKVTLAMPIYNVSHFIERALLSALNQTYKDIEYLIIDDRGQDNSIDIVNEIIKKHPRGKDVRIIEHPYNIGLGATRNTAIDNAQGEYIFFMDSDDEIIPKCIEILVKKEQEHPVDFVAASHIKKDTDGHFHPVYSYNDLLIEGGYKPVVKYRYIQNKELYVMTWNKLYNLAFLKSNNIRCIENQLVEDCWFTYQVIMNAASCQLLSTKTLYYTTNPESTTEKLKSQGYSMRLSLSYVEIEKAKRIYISDLRDQSPYPHLLVDIMFMGLYHAYRILSVQDNNIKERERLAGSLLKRNFHIPSRFSFFTLSPRFLLMYIYYSLPLGLKINLMKASIRIDLRKQLRKWFHFN